MVPRPALSTPNDCRDPNLSVSLALSLFLLDCRGSRVSKYKDGQIPAKLNVGFAIVSQGFDGKEGYLRIQGCEGPNVPTQSRAEPEQSAAR